MITLIIIAIVSLIISFIKLKPIDKNLDFDENLIQVSMYLLINGIIISSVFIFLIISSCILLSVFPKKDICADIYKIGSIDSGFSEQGNVYSVLVEIPNKGYIKRVLPADETYLVFEDNNESYVEYHEIKADYPETLNKFFLFSWIEEHSSNVNDYYKIRLGSGNTISTP